MRGLTLLCLFSLHFGFAQLSNIPWITDEAITLVEQYVQDHPNPRVLEFGIAGSTLWFAKRTPNLTTAEERGSLIALFEDEIAKPGSPYNPVEFILWSKPYHTLIAQYPDEEFDIVFVENANGIECVEDSMRIIKPGGLLVLEEAERDRYIPVYTLLKDWALDETTQMVQDPMKYRYLGTKSNCWTKPLPKKDNV